MKKALQVFSIVLCMAAALGAAAAQAPLMDAQDAAVEGLMQTTPLTGTVTRPDGVQAPEAAFLLSYELPQFEGDAEVCEPINRYYRDMAQGMADASKTLQEEGGQYHINFEITHLSHRYASVVLSRIFHGGNAEQETLSADTFALDGMYAGEGVTLSQVLGLEGDDSSQSLAETLAYELVWQMIEQEMQNVDHDYLDGLNRQDVQRAFVPETDFYLDDSGNVVFFIQAGELAGEIAGVLRFPFARAELLSVL